MIARLSHHLDIGLCRPDELGRCKKLINGDELVLGPCQQQHWNAELGEIELSPQSHESSFGDLILLEQLLDDLKIIGSWQIDGPGIPSAEALFELTAAVRIHIGCKLKHTTNVIATNCRSPKLEHAMSEYSTATLRSLK